jgi:hypothetical protein
MALAVMASAAERAVSLVRSNPAVMSKLSEYYSKATGKTVDLSKPGVTDAVIKRGPAPQAVLLRGAVSAGVNPNDIFEGIILREQADGATGRIIDELRAVYSDIATAENSRSTIKGRGAKSLAEALFRKEVILFAANRFGSSAQTIRETHAKLRAFLDMDTESVEAEIALHLGR